MLKCKANSSNILLQSSTSSAYYKFIYEILSKISDMWELNND